MLPRFVCSFTGRGSQQVQLLQDPGRDRGVDRHREKELVQAGPERRDGH